jgi:predicted RNase H-like nuclease (RuvC/YqgF family)
VSEIRGGVSDDPGRIIYELEEQLKTANAKISYQTAENERLQAEWQSQFIAAQQLRSENERLQAEIERLQGELLQSEARNTADTETAEYAARLEMQLDNSRDALRDLQEDHTAMDNRAEGARLAYLAVIKALWEMRR